MYICHTWTRGMNEKAVISSKPLDDNGKHTGMVFVFFSNDTCNPCTRVTKHTAVVVLQPLHLAKRHTKILTYAFSVQTRHPCPRGMYIEAAVWHKLSNFYE